MYQKVTLIGRLGGDVEKRFTAQGKAVASFSLAVGRNWTDANGNRKETTVWFRVSAWERLAEVCEKYLSKGKLVFVEGELTEPRPYQGRDGEWRASLDLTARTVQFLDSRRDAASPDAAGELDEQEIPF